MDIVTLARATLRETEERLRSFVFEAATSGDYANVVQIASWARIVHELTESLPEEQKKNSAGRRGSSGQLATIKGVGSTHHQSARSSKRNDYPRFFRQGNQLIRIAWSKREKKEYRHKTLYTAVEALATAMASEGADGRVFSTDQFLPIHDPTDGSVVPSYQSYVGLSLLKQAGLIDQHGRQGYSIPRIAEFKAAVKAVWKKLPEQ